MKSRLGLFGALWGGVGVLILLGSAVFRLTPYAINTFSYELHWYHWVLIAVSIIYLTYSEGYRGFQQAFSPRLVARLKYLKTHPRLRHVIFAPLYGMGYIHATTKRRITSISLTVGIIILVILVRMLNQPWRGIVDLGVVIGLVWGITTIFFFIAKALNGDHFAHPTDIPGDELELD